MRSQVVESLGVDRVIMLPGRVPGAERGRADRCRDHRLEGHCEVHERFTAEEIRELREAHPGVEMLAHPECPPEVLAEADFAGSTAAMIDYVGERRPAPGGAGHRVLDERQRRAASTRTSSSCGPAICART